MLGTVLQRKIQVGRVHCKEDLFFITFSLEDVVNASRTAKTFVNLSSFLLF